MDSPYDYPSLPPTSQPYDARSNRSTDSMLELTLDLVDWSLLERRVLDQHPEAVTCEWRDRLIAGGYNLVRFLDLKDKDGGTTIELVARVPLRPLGGYSKDQATRTCTRLSSEIATMHCVAERTRIPIPQVIVHCTDIDGDGVGAPYMIMSRVPGEPLSAVWEQLGDGERDCILKQVIDILLQLSTLRFDAIGALIDKADGGTDGSPYEIIPTASILYVSEDPRLSILPPRTYRSSLDYWTRYATANMQQIDEERFGQGKKYDYAVAWFLRSIVPSVCDPTLDDLGYRGGQGSPSGESGFPLCHGDFHSQNIMVDNLDTPTPRITGVIDWEFTSTEPTASFAQFPLFLVDHPHWPEDHTLRERNVRDREVFLGFLEQAEKERLPDNGLALTNAFASSRGMYLFQQCLQHPMYFQSLERPLFEHFYGPADSDSGDHYFVESCYQALLRGVLASKARQFDDEEAIWGEAREVLGEETVSDDMNRASFREIVEQEQDRFAEDSLVRRWIVLGT